MPTPADPAMNYLEAFGEKAEAISLLTWALLILSIAVVAIIALLTAAGVTMRRTSLAAEDAKREPVLRPSGGLSWITVGVALSTLALFASMAWNAYTMAAVNRPPRAPALTIEVIGHQWWWQFRYKSDDPAQTFETANEAHIPIGAPVRLEVRTQDVIHSFWIPALGEKIDLIPSQTNVTWFEAEKPGVYRGQCAEYCGQQHAHMAIAVVAETPEAFQAWRVAQLHPAEAQQGGLIEGEALFQARCSACHTVRGTLAGGKLGPDLTHVASRLGIAANTLQNTTATLSGWIADPQRIKPGNKMPTLDLQASELGAIRRYVQSLK
ncbi:cytochrome c oxidase subunit II [Methylocystis echinoides]|jgi:cytochrome c oxidase subunit 2|uniref:cytochrome c oxidase subunit II n=1 Tax=Methylocystis echinoides TaxID=29468 RepID=UPI003438B0AA